MCKSTTILSHMCDPLQDVIKKWWPFLHAVHIYAYPNGHHIAHRVHYE
jgi:hypothetical protein